ncbi:metallophosphoesterase family protein [Coprothermobacter proteolyticus]|uniref:metallophosphoesterase family protein n=1 Tax=Coprothermobacter proteolyticus TaxID=35786 RepID=UPI000D2F6FC3|nr:metallophosphoesterase [Coprothermobacter proteolyticus]
MRVLVTGDWHLGAVTWRRKPQDRTPEIQACLSEILDFLSQERVDLIAVTGDFTHYWVPLEGEKQRWLMDYLYALSEHAPVVGVLGNHDWRGLVSFDKFARKKDVYIIDKFGQLELNLNGTKVCIVILPYFDARKVLQPYQKLTSDGVKDTAKQVVLNDLSPRSCSWDANYRILITHGVVEGLAYSELGGNDVPIPKSALSQFDFAFLGHIHNAQMIKDDSTGRIVGCYPGGVAKLDFGEMGSTQGFWIVDLSPKGPDCKLIQFSSQKPLKRVEVAGPVTPEVREEIMGTNGYVKAVLKEGDLVTVQKLYDLEPVVVVELKSAVSTGSEGSTGEGESKVRFSSLEEAYGLYLNHYPELAEDKRDELLRRFSSYLRKAKENKS